MIHLKQRYKITSDTHTIPARMRCYYVYFEIMMDSCAAVRNNTGRSPLLFAQFPPMVTPCRMISQHHNPDIGLGAANTQGSPITTSTRCAAFFGRPGLTPRNRLPGLRFCSFVVSRVARKRGYTVGDLRAWLSLLDVLPGAPRSPLSSVPSVGAPQSEAVAGSGLTDTADASWRGRGTWRSRPQLLPPWAPS